MYRDQPHEVRRDPTVAAAFWFCLVLAFLTPFFLFAWLFYASFYIGADPPPATAGEVQTYEFIAIAGLVVALAAVVLAFVLRSGWRIATSLVIGALVLAAAALFALPQGRWAIPDPTYPPNPDYTPCYSGSNNCGP